MSDRTPLDKAEEVAISALNRAYEKHGLQKIMNCNFCTSRAAEMTIARHFEPAYQEIERLRERVEELEQRNAKLEKLREKVGDYQQHEDQRTFEAMNEALADCEDDSEIEDP